MAGDSKTEKATPKKRRDERKKGNVLMSKDAVAVATLIGSLFMVQMMGGVFMEQMGQVLNTCFGYIASGTVETLPVELPVLLKRTALSFFAVVGPFLGGDCGAGRGCDLLPDQAAGDNRAPTSQIQPAQPFAGL